MATSPVSPAAPSAGARRRRLGRTYDVVSTAGRARSPPATRFPSSTYRAPRSTCQTGWSPTPGSRHARRGELPDLTSPRPGTGASSGPHGRPRATGSPAFLLDDTTDLIQAQEDPPRQGGRPAAPAPPFGATGPVFLAAATGRDRRDRGRGKRARRSSAAKHGRCRAHPLAARPEPSAAPRRGLRPRPPPLHRRRHHRAASAARALERRSATRATGRALQLLLTVTFPAGSPHPPVQPRGARSRRPLAGDFSRGARPEVAASGASPSPSRKGSPSIDGAWHARAAAAVRAGSRSALDADRLQRAVLSPPRDPECAHRPAHRFRGQHRGTAALEKTRRIGEGIRRLLDVPGLSRGLPPSPTPGRSCRQSTWFEPKLGRSVDPRDLSG
jgi:hypothetical protein